MRLCKIQAARESEPVNQALRHRPVVCQIVFFDLLMYASDARMVQTVGNRSSTAERSTLKASLPITTGAYMRYNRSNEPSTDMAPRIRAEMIPFSGGSCCSSPISRALAPTLLCRDLGLFAEHR